jgi:hypothetical protein
MMPQSTPPQDLDPRTPGERKADALTLLLAGVLAAVVIGAIGYGIFNSTRMVTAIPAATTGHSVR